VKGILEERLNSLLIGANPLDIEFLRRKLIDSQVYFERKGSAICAASALEMACWDIKGKALQVPVYQLLGGMCQPSLEAYVSDIYWEEKPEAMAKSAERILGQGFGSVKAHIGYREPADEVKRVRALREAIGDKTRLMIDLNAGYTYSQALKAAQLWEPFDIYWLEEPLNPNHLGRAAELRAHSNIPIAAGENEFQLYGFKEMFDAGAVDFAMPDIGRAGGLQETKNICALAESCGIEVSPHNFSSGVLLAATLHLMAATPNTSLLEFDSSENAVYRELFVEPLKVEKGRVQVPHGPGLGVQLSAEIIEKFAIS